MTTDRHYAQTAKRHLDSGMEPSAVARLLRDGEAGAMETARALTAAGLSLTEAKAAIDASGCWPGRAEAEAWLFDMGACCMAVEEVMAFLASRDYAGAITHCHRSRLSESDLERVVRDYGRTIMEPPPETYETIDAIQHAEAADPTFSVNFPVWTAEEGRSDLTLQLTVGWRQATPDAPYSIHIELDDLRVL